MWEVAAIARPFFPWPGNKVKLVPFIAPMIPPHVETFLEVFGGSAAQTEIIDKIGYPVGASDTDNGVTVTADAVMGDAYNAVIVYTISRDDGTRLLPEDITG